MLSCIYKNDEIFVHPVNPPSATNSSINLNNVIEPIIINQPTQFSFTVSPAGKEFYEAIVKVDGSSVAQLSSSTGIFGFTINPEIVGDGTKKLQINVEYLSLSPSLAGQLGQETITFSNEWSITIDTTPPSPIPAPQVYIDNGKSMISWTSPDKFTFTELIIYRRYLDNNNNIISWDSIKINSHNSTSYHDASYVGGPIKYRIDLKGFKYYIQGGETFFNVDPMSFTLNTEGSTTSLSWEGSPLYNNDLKITLNSISYPLDQPGQISYNVKFGEERVVILRSQANNPPPNPAGSIVIRESSIYVHQGIRIVPFIDVEYIPSSNVYLMLTAPINSKIYTIDAESFQIINILPVSNVFDQKLIVSQDGNYIYFVRSDRLRRFDISGNTLGAEIRLSDIIGQFSSPFDLTSVSNDNIFVAKFANKHYAFDLNSNQILWQKTSSGSPFVSPDSEYICSNNSIHIGLLSSWNSVSAKLSESNFNKVVYQNHGGNFVLAYKNNDTNTYFYDLNSIPDNSGFIHPLNTLPTSFQLDMHGLKYFKIDNNTCISYNIVSLAEDRRIEDIFNPEKTILVNNHFFHSNGFVIP